MNMTKITKKIIAWVRNSDVVRTRFRVIAIDPTFEEVFHDFDNFYHEISCGFYEEREQGKQIHKYDKYRSLERNGYLGFSNKDKKNEFIVTYEKGEGEIVKIIEFFQKAGVKIVEAKED